MSLSLSWLDEFFLLLVRAAGVDLPKRGAINFIGATVADNPTTKATDVTISGAGSTAMGGSCGGTVAAATVKQIDGNAGVVQIVPAQIDFLGGTDSDGHALPYTRTNRVGKQTTNNTQTTVATVSIPTDHEQVRIVAEYHAIRTDDSYVSGDRAYFCREILLFRAGSSLTVITADHDAKPAAHNGTSSAWAGVIDASSGTNVAFKVTGENSKTIQWRLVVEIFAGDVS